MPHHNRYWVAVLTVGGVLAAATAEQPKGKPVKIEQEWKAGSKAEVDSELWRKSPADNVVKNQADLAKLWAAWKLPGDVPAVDFDKELVLVTAGAGPNEIKIVPPVLDANGNLTFRWTLTTVEGPGFAARLIKVPRAGVQLVNGKPLK